MIQALYLMSLKEKCPSFAECFRFKINLCDNTISKEKLAEERIELPNISYPTHNRKNYRYFYAASAAHPGEFLNRLVKINITKFESNIWQEENCYTSEPIFVAEPSVHTEDKGIILAVILDTKTKLSLLLILDAYSFEEVARIYLPHIIPFGFHGQFFYM